MLLNSLIFIICIVAVYFISNEIDNFIKSTNKELFLKSLLLYPLELLIILLLICLIIFSYFILVVNV